MAERAVLRCSENRRYSAIGKDAETHELAHELVALTGESITKAVHIAIRERLQKMRAGRPAQRRLADRPDDIARHCAALPIVRDRR